MAIKKTVTTPHGLTAENAYHRVEGINFKSKTEISFRVRASKDGALPHFSDTEYYCNYDLSGANPYLQAYNHLKTLPEFSGAVDC